MMRRFIRLGFYGGLAWLVLVASASIASAQDVEGELESQPTAAGDGDSPKPVSPADDALTPHVRVYGGAGLGMRDFEWPGLGERLAVETGLFAALDAGIHFAVGIGERLALGAAFQYQTSLAHQIEETHIAGQPDTLRIRSHRFDGTFVLQIGRRDGFHVAPGVGVAFNNLRPEVHHLRTPNYSLVGPVLRVAVRIPLGPLGLRIAPEAQWLFTDGPLAEIGVDGSGPAIGAELALEFPIARTLAIEVAARGLRAWLPAREGAKAIDTGSFATTRLVWQP